MNNPPLVPPDGAAHLSVVDLARTLGWGELSPADAWNFLHRREQMLRMAQAELETHKSHAATAELAIRDRVNTLKKAAQVAPDGAAAALKALVKKVRLFQETQHGYPECHEESGIHGPCRACRGLDKAIKRVEAALPEARRQEPPLT